MSLRTYLQDRPAPLVWAWKITEKILLRAKPLFERIGEERSSRLLHPVEKLGKHLLFDCQSCGQCVLHYTGMTCPMTCPKQLRNGPCGGVRLNGKCEVKPENDCVWFKAYERSQRIPEYAHEIYRLNPPVDWRLQNMASWVTVATGRDQVSVGCETGIKRATDVLEAK